MPAGMKLDKASTQNLVHHVVKARSTSSSHITDHSQAEKVDTLETLICVRKLADMRAMETFLASRTQLEVRFF